MVKRKLVTVADFGPIMELDGIGGPLRTPTNITLSAICQMVVNGKTVFEHNPANVKEKVRLTLSNVKADNFVNEEPVVEPEPVPQDVIPTPEEVEQSLDAATTATENLAEALAEATAPVEEVPTEVVEEPVPEEIPAEEPVEIDETAIDEQGVTHEEPLVQEDVSVAVENVAEALAEATGESVEEAQSAQQSSKKNKNKNR
jgi:hypothetical protein